MTLNKASGFELITLLLNNSLFEYNLIHTLIMKGSGILHQLLCTYNF